MTDLSKTIEAKSDQLNADDLLAGPRTVKITRVVGRDDAQQPIWIYYEGDNNKPFKPSKSMRRVLVEVWGREGDAYVGRSMTLFNDRTVMFGGIEVGGIRISHMSHIDRSHSMMLTKTRGSKKEFIVKPLAADQTGQALLAAQEAADNGTEALQKWWTGDGRPHQKALADKLPKLKERAAQADEEAKPLSQRLQSEEEPTAAPEGAPEATDTNTPHPAFMEGIEAHAKGVNDTDCPYDNDPEKQAWLDGWFEAENK